MNSWSISKDKIYCSIINKIKKETKIDSINNKNAKYITLVNNNNQNPNTNMRYSYQIKKYKINKDNQINVNQKIYNYSNKFHHVNIGTYRKNNKFDLYKKYCHSPQINRIKLKEKSIENSWLQWILQLITLLIQNKFKEIYR